MFLDLSKAYLLLKDESPGRSRPLIFNRASSGISGFAKNIKQSNQTSANEPLMGDHPDFTFLYFPLSPILRETQVFVLV